MQIKLSIIIVHHKTPELLRLCLKSIKNIDEQISKEVIVIDSQSTRETRDVVIEDFPNDNIALLPFKENIGYSKGVNSGIRRSSGKYLLVLNPDIILTKNSIKLMVDFMENNPQTGMVGPQLLNFSGEVQKSCFRFYTPLTIFSRRTFLGKLPIFKKINERFLMVDADLNKTQEPDWMMGSALMVSREAVKKVGVMDERFFLYFEDVDWARRFWENGYKVVYYPPAKMHHYHQRKSKAGFDFLDIILRKETRWHLMSAIKYFIKYGTRNPNFNKQKTA